MAQEVKFSRKYIVGIDEAGRGPLAGPVAVGVVKAKTKKGAHIKRALSGIRDSKKMSAETRDKWVLVARQLREEGCIEYTVAFVGSKHIDKTGIVPSVSLGIRRSLDRLKVPVKNTYILLDGGLRAPSIYTSQKTIIRGDESEPLISLASILAKVRRDRYMKKCSKKYPQYFFEQHKGYGTKLHIKQIHMHGICDLHRRSFVYV